MADRINQPKSTDGVLGGAPFPGNGAVLGGLEGVKHRLEKGGIQEQIAALADALNYGPAGQELLEQIDRQAPQPLRTAISFLQHYGAKHPAFQMLRQSQVLEFEVVTVDDQGRPQHRSPQQNLRVIEYGAPGVTLELMAIPGGEFLMGSSGRGGFEAPQHRVKVAPFYLGRYPVTQEQWRSITQLEHQHCNLNPISAILGGDRQRPVEQVRWEEAQEACDRLLHHSGRPYRLPSEAEWEYACRAGTTTDFHFGDTITTALANYNGTYPYENVPKGIYRQKTTIVGSFPPNAFGLYDTHGNVLEWCADAWHENYQSAPGDGRVWQEGGDRSRRVVRGGAWDGYPHYCRSTTRRWGVLTSRILHTGFRVACFSASPLHTEV